jgi:hypothetical protein
MIQIDTGIIPQNRVIPLVKIIVINDFLRIGDCLDCFYLIPIARGY